MLTEWHSHTIVRLTQVPATPTTYFLRKDSDKRLSKGPVWYTLDRYS
jgi:hypothetical protein